MTARLPTPGGDNNTWGDVLNNFLEISHNADGTLQPTAISQAGGITNSQVGIANGVAGLNGSSQVPAIQLGSGTASSSNFLRGDGTWAVPSGGGTLSGDTDVSISTPTNDQVLTYNSSSGKWANASIPAASTSARGIIQIDGVASDVQPLGSQAAGSIGKVADAGHVHAMPRLDQVNNPTTSLSLNAQKITNLANGSSAQDAAAFGQIPTSASSIGGLLASNNLSDATNSSTARNNIGASQGLTPVAVKTGAYTASPGDFVPVDASSGSVTITLPTTPADKSRVEVKMIATSAANTVAINTGGSDVFNKSGGSTSGTLTLLNQALMLQYAASSAIWYVQSDDLPLSQLDNRYGLSAQAWQFKVSAYGAKGDGKIVTDAVMASSSANLACTTSTPFTSADVGKNILVSTAKGSYAHLSSTINTFTDSGHVVLANSATATTGGTPGAIAYYGTDDTAAIQSAINAAATYAQAHNGYAEVLFDPVIYIIAGAFTVGGSGLGNNQIALPNIPQTTSAHITLAFIGGEESTSLINWAQTLPQVAGATLASVRTDGTNNGTYGPAHIIGGPVNGYGGESGASTGWNNLHLVVRGMSTLSPYNATFGGMDLFSVASCDIQSFSALTAAVVPTTSAPAPSMSAPSNISNQWGWGLRLPAAGNNAKIAVGSFACEGHCYGFGPSEHSATEATRCIYNITGIEAHSGNGVSMTHAGFIGKATVEGCTNAVGFFDGGIKLDIASLCTESISSKQVFDPSNRGQGVIVVRPQNAGGFYGSSWVNGGSGVRLINGMTNAGPLASPQAAPSSGSAWTNYYYRDAWITLSATTITALSIDSTAQNGLAGSPATYTFLLPSGHAYTPTYTGTLTHTVTLL